MSARFPKTCATVDEALVYYQNRSIQLLSRGWSWDGNHLDHGWGVEVHLKSPWMRYYASVFVLEGHTGQGHLSRWFDQHDVVDGMEFATSDDCPLMQSWLYRHDIPYQNLDLPDSRAYKAVSSFYGDHRAKRSGQFFMNHIDEGLDILTQLRCNSTVKDAWCLHPLVQNDEDLQATLAAGGHLNGQDPAALILAMEYRHQANGHLSKHAPKLRPTWGPLDEVRDMLIADKMQNRKDFDLHLRGHPDVTNGNRLDSYFREWFDALGITDDQYNLWTLSLSRRTGQEPQCP